MKRSLNRELKSNPTIGVKQKIGGFFEGKMLTTARIVPLKRGSGKVFDFQVIDTDMPIQKKNADGIYVDVDVAVGDVVTIFAPTALAGMFEGAKIGETIRFNYAGKKLTKGGTEYHAFSGEVTE